MDKTNEQEKEKSLDLYHAYLSNGTIMLLYNDYPYNIQQKQVDEMGFITKLQKHRLQVWECMAAYYVLTGHKNFDPELVMSALLEGLNPKSIVVCKNQWELVAEMSKKQLDGVLWDIGVYDVASAYSRY